MEKCQLYMGYQRLDIDTLFSVAHTYDSSMSFEINQPEYDLCVLCTFLCVEVSILWQISASSSHA
jgi:hypothetical protein